MLIHNSFFFIAVLNSILLLFCDFLLMFKSFIFLLMFGLFLVACEQIVSMGMELITWFVKCGNKRREAAERCV